MFCKNCGKEIEDGAKFCASCGAAAEVNDVAQQKPRGRKETVVVEVPKQRQQDTIIRYQKMGWRQIGLQEVSNSEAQIQPKGKKKAETVELAVPYVNLTFERNVGEVNFNQLDRIYKEYRNIEEDYQKKEAEWTRTVLSVSRLGKLTLLFAVVGLPFVFRYCAELEWFFYAIFIAFLLDVTVACLVGGLILNPIIGAIKKSRAKKKYAPLILQYEEKMNALANEAEQYLT